MSQTIMKLADNAEQVSGWKNLYKLGAASAVTAIPIFLLDIIISLGGGDLNPDTLTAIDWFALFQGNWLLGLRMLGLINIINLTVTIPMYFAICSAHRQTYKAEAILAMMLFLVGVAIYISNNAAIPMFVLSNKYAMAETDAQRSLIAAAGEAIVARGADFTPGSFIGFFYTEITGITFSIMMLRGRVFGKATACFGILGFTLLTVFTIWLTFIPVLFDVAMSIAMIGGLSSMGWYILVACRLLRLGRQN